MNAKKKILWVKIGNLHPLDTGGKIRTFNMLKNWSQRHDVTFISQIDERTPAELLEQASTYSSRQVWCKRKEKKHNPILYLIDLFLNHFFSSLPYIVYKYQSREFQDLLSKEVQSGHFDLIVVDFLQASYNVIQSGINLSNAVLFQHNVESLIWKRHCDESKNIFLKYYMRKQWLRCKSYEQKACKKMKSVIAVSKEDADYFKNEMGLSNVNGYVKTGVDITYFSGMGRNPQKNNMIFLGSMDWMPNIVGIINFVENVFPLVKARIPDISLTIVGRNPPDSVKSLGLDEAVEVTGTVEDVRPYLKSATLSIVPLTVGGGTRLKIFELMAAGVPVVSTTLGAEGLPVIHTENILIADEKEAFADEIIKLIQDQELQKKLAENAFELVSTQYTWEKVVDEFDQLCEMPNISN